MLYLAEVQKKTKLLGSGKAELKLLAQQRAEDRWQALASGEILSSEKANDFNAGVLVLVDVSDKSGQIQRIQDATRLILTNLQNASRLQDKLKDQEDEIEQWKQSLTYQSQELNRREAEMEQRREQMQQLEEEMAQLEQQKQEALALRSTANELRQELERREQEFQAAQQQLEAERSQLESRKQEIQSSAVVNSDQVTQLQERLTQFSGVVVPSDAVREQVNNSFEILNNQKSLLAQHWQQLEHHQSNAYQLQEGLNQTSKTLRERWEAWYQSQAELEQAKADLAALHQALDAQQNYVQVQQRSLEVQELLHQQITSLAGGIDPEVAQQVNFEALDQMALKDLEDRVKEIQKDYEKTYNFVNDQEEELRLLSQDIETKKEQISEASEYDRLTLENELADLQSEYQLFDESVVPQRKRLGEAKAILAAYQGVLTRRKGHTVEQDGAAEIDFRPLLGVIESQRQQCDEALQQISEQIETLQNQIDQVTSAVADKESQQQQHRQELQNLEDELLNQHASVSELWGKVKTYQELLQPLQDASTHLDEKLQEVNQELNRVQEVGDYQLQLLADIQKGVSELTA